MKIYVAALLVTIGLIGASANNSQTVSAAPYLVAKMHGKSMPLHPKGVPNQAKPLVTVMTIEGDKVRVCGRSKATGSVDQRKCQTAYLSPLVPAAAKHIELELSSSAHTWMSLHERKASVCRFDLRYRKVYCLPVPAPIPTNVDVKYVSLADNMKFMQYTPKLGFRMLDMNVNEINAFDKALKQVTSKTRSILMARDSKSLRTGFMSNMCVKDEDEENGCLEEAMPDPWEEPGYPPEDWWPDPEPQPDYREPEPDPTETAGGCTASPIAVVCIRGERPPPAYPEEQPLPASPTPWLPQGWCDFATILCSENQEPRDNNRGPRSEHRGKTLDELKAICYEILDVEHEVCETNFKMTKDYGIRGACRQRAWDRLQACVETAKSVTDNGAHPAP